MWRLKVYPSVNVRKTPGVKCCVEEQEYVYIYIHYVHIMCVCMCQDKERCGGSWAGWAPDVCSTSISSVSPPRVTFTPEHSHVLRNNWSTTIWFSAWLSSYWAFWMTAMVYTWMDGGRDGWLSSFLRCSIEEDKHLTRIKTFKDLNEADTLRQENISRHRTCHRIIKSFFFKELWSSEPQMLRLPAWQLTSKARAPLV